jgi:hypothetical protein
MARHVDREHEPSPGQIARVDRGSRRIGAHTFGVFGNVALSPSVPPIE